MIETYEYSVTKQCQAFQIPSEEDNFWENGEGQICFKFSFCPFLVLKEGVVYLQVVSETTLRGVPGDFLVYLHGELLIVKEKVFKLKYKKV